MASPSNRGPDGRPTSVGLPSSPSGSFLPYQERLLSRTSSTTAKTSLNILAGGSSANKLNRTESRPPGPAPRGHVAGQRSIDAVRGKWEQRVEAAESERSSVQQENTGPSKETKTVVQPPPPSPRSTGGFASPTSSLAGRRAMWDSMASVGAAEMIPTPRSPGLGGPPSTTAQRRAQSSMVPPSSITAHNEDPLIASPHSATTYVVTPSTAGASTSSFEADNIAPRAPRVTSMMSPSDSDRSFSSSTNVSSEQSGAKMIQQQFTGSSNATSASSVVGPDGKKFRSSYMARREAMKRASVNASATGVSGPEDAPYISKEEPQQEDLATLTRKMLHNLPGTSSPMNIREDLPREVQIDDAMRKLIANVSVGADVRFGQRTESPVASGKTLQETTKEVMDGLRDMQNGSAANMARQWEKVSVPDTTPKKRGQGDLQSVFLQSAVQSTSSPGSSSRHRALREDTFSPPSQISSTPPSKVQPPGTSPSPVPTRSAFRSVVAPPSAPTLSRSDRLGVSDIPSSSTSTLSPATASTASKYGSIGKTDGRRLGRHLPRIVSGDGQDESLHSITARDQSRSREPQVPDTSVPVSSSEVITKPTYSTAPSGHGVRLREIIPESPPASPTVPSRSWQAPSTHSAKPNWRSPALTPFKVMPDGKGMAGLVGKTVAPATPLADMPTQTGLQRNGSVTGVRGRIRLSRLPLSSTSAAVAPAPLPSRRLNTNWMDRQRKELITYEYLCHVGEALQWIEGCLGEELSIGVIEMEEGMRDGVALAKLARVYEGEAVVRHIWEDKKHRFRQTENINYFLNFVRKVGLPETFIFETTDLYNKKNMPKVIYCIHVLSHLLARLGKAEKIGNLVGQFDFSDEQLAQARAGLQGVAMPNFSTVGNALAKECNMAPEEEPETEEEVRDRLLLKCEGNICQLQALLRGHLARMAVSRTNAQMALSEKSILKFQSRARGCMSRRKVRSERDEKQRASTWIVDIQAVARAAQAKRRFAVQMDAIRNMQDRVPAFQARCRGALARRRKRSQDKALASVEATAANIQAAVRGHLARRSAREEAKSFHQRAVQDGVTSLQSRLRTSLVQRRAAMRHKELQSYAQVYPQLQASLRGFIVRKALRAQVQTLDDSVDRIIQIQAAVRSLLARRRRQHLVVTLTQTVPSVVSLQSLARARLAKRTHADMQKALSKVEVATSVGGLQAFLRSRLAKKSTQEQKKRLEFVSPDVIGFQAQARGCLARRDYFEWLDYLRDGETQAGITFLQQLLRGHLEKQRLRARLWHIYSNIPKVVTIQSLWRGRKQRDRYRKIISGQAVDVAAIQSFMHLLDDSENDFNEEIQIERLRKQVVDHIRANQMLEVQVGELDIKIALLLQNKLSFEELIKFKGLAGATPAAARDSEAFNFTQTDPFSHGANLGKATRRRLELYQHMFFLLQTDPKYLAKLFRLLSASALDIQQKKKMEEVILALYGYGQGRREDFLMHKLLQMAIHEEILNVDLVELVESRPFVTSIALAYVRPAQGAALKSIFQKGIQVILKIPNLDLSIDPVAIYHRLLNDEESESGVISTKPRDVTAHYAVNIDPVSSTAFYEQMRQLQDSTEVILQALYTGIEHIPYTVRCMAREMLLALRAKTQDSVDDIHLTPIIAGTLLVPYMKPALVAPDAHGITSNVIGALTRQNLSEIETLITVIATGAYSQVAFDPSMYAPLVAYIQYAVPLFADWVLDVASVDNVETYLHTQELVEVGVEPKPVTVSRAEIYSLHSMLLQHQDAIAPSKQDLLRSILEELEGVPNVAYQDGSTTPVTLVLSNRFATVQDDPLAPQKAEWVQAKRHALAALRVQTGRTLIDMLTAKVVEEDEWAWEDVVFQDIDREKSQKRKSQLPSPPAIGQEYRLEDIRSLPFREVKARAIQFCMRLESQGLLSRSNDWQDLLNDIAADIRSKNKNRQRRKKDYAAMSEAMSYASDKKVALEEQITSYNKYINSAMDTMQRQGKKRFVWPFSKQHRHLKAMERAGKSVKFGSFKYSALELYEKHVLLPSEQFSPKQFEKLFLVISSDQVGLFTLELIHPGGPIPELGSCEIRMEDLLQAKFENKSTLDMFDQVARVRVNTLIFLINKKFYA